MARRDPRFLLFDASPESFRWSGLALLGTVFFGSLAFAALLAPFLFHAAVAWVTENPGHWNRWLEGRTDPSDFPRYFDRLRWLPVLLALPWLIRVCRLWSWKRLGWEATGGAFSQIVLGLALGAATLLIVTTVQVLAGAAVVKPEADLADRFWVGMVAAALLGALLLGFLEETIFRGLVLKIFYTALRPLWAVAWASVFFALTHFKRVSWPDDQPVGLFSGWEVAGLTLGAAFSTFQFLPWVNLTLCGVVLAILFLRSGALWLSLGVHAGWVFARSLNLELITAAPTQAAFFWGTPDLRDGLLSTVVLVLACVVALRFPVRVRAAAGQD